MVSVLVGVAIAAGGHLLWINPPGGGTNAALPGGESETPFSSQIRRGQAGSSSAQADTTTTEDVPATPTETSTAPRRSPSSATTEPSRTTTAPPTTTTNPPRRTTTPPPSTSTARVEGGGGPLSSQVVNLVNDERADEGCDPVTVDSRLTLAAQSHSDDMARRGYLQHTTPEGVPFDQRIRRAGYPRPAAENIAMGLSSAEAVMDAWMSSDGHRRNILNCDITAIGVGVHTSGWYWTQNFGY